MNVLVLGGSVFVGRHVVDRLVAGGHNVAVLNRGKTVSALPDGVERLVADRTDLDQMRRVLANRDWDAVIDVSGFVMAAGGTDFDGLLGLFDGHVGRYVYVSSIMAYDQSLVGQFPWTEDLPTNADGPRSYGGFKALAESALLQRHAATGFPAVVGRPAAIYGPDNNIFDMETPMFLRLLKRRPILMPHGGLVVGSYGHVDDLCDALAVMTTHPAAVGEVFNITGQSIDVLRYIDVLARVVGVEPVIVAVPDAELAVLSASLRGPMFGHLFSDRHHASLSTDKAERVLDVRPAFGLADGHQHTYEWFRQQGWHHLTGALADPVWRASWDFDVETSAATTLGWTP
jgi:nucleoside-diphosphate-sugar epimerase